MSIKQSMKLVVNKMCISESLCSRIDLILSCRGVIKVLFIFTFSLRLRLQFNFSSSSKRRGNERLDGFKSKLQFHLLNENSSSGFQFRLCWMKMKGKRKMNVAKYRRPSLFTGLVFADLKTANNEGKLLFLAKFSLF